MEEFSVSSQFKQEVFKKLRDKGLHLENVLLMTVAVRTHPHGRGICILEGACTMCRTPNECGAFQNFPLAQ